MIKKNILMILGGLVIITIAVFAFKAMTTKWKTISTNFLQTDKPYGGGAFRIDGTKFMTLKVVDPEIKFKPIRERTNPERAEPTEAWMSNPAELLNRTTVS